MIGAVNAHVNNAHAVLEVNRRRTLLSPPRFRAVNTRGRGPGDVARRTAAARQFSPRRVGDTTRCVCRDKLGRGGRGDAFSSSGGLPRPGHLTFSEGHVIEVET